MRSWYILMAILHFFFNFQKKKKKKTWPDLWNINQLGTIILSEILSIYNLKFGFMVRYYVNHIRPPLTLMTSHTYVDSCQQMQWLLVELTLVLVLVQSTWTMLFALAVRTTWLTVNEALLAAVLVVTKRMQEYDVEVNEFYVSVRHSCPIYTGIECEIACIMLLHKGNA